MKKNQSLKILCYSPFNLDWRGIMPVSHGKYQGAWELVQQRLRESCLPNRDEPVSHGKYQGAWELVQQRLRESCLPNRDESEMPTIGGLGRRPWNPANRGEIDDG